MSAYFELGVQLSDEELADLVRLRHWTMTEAFFWLQGQRSPGIEYSEGLRAWYPSAYNDAVRAIEIGELGQKVMRAGERVFIDTPTNWLAWADSLAPADLNVDERVRRLLPSGERRAEPAPSRPTSGSNAAAAVQTAEDISPDVDSQSDEPNAQSSAPGRDLYRSQ